MSEITERMIVECYEAYKRNELSFVPEGMNISSAKMTMKWLDSLFTGKPYNRTGSAMQYGVVLSRIRDDYGDMQMMQARDILIQYCENALVQYGMRLKKHRKVLEGFKS